MTVSISNLNFLWANSSNVFTAIGANVNASSFAAGSKVLKFVVNGNQIFNVDSYGNTNTVLLKANSITTGNITAAVYLSKIYVGANIPAANSVGAGARAFVVDSNSSTFGATYAGSSSIKVPVWSDGANWKVG